MALCGDISRSKWGEAAAIAYAEQEDPLEIDAGISAQVAERLAIRRKLRHR
jgi:hypothetical protein